MHVNVLQLLSYHEGSVLQIVCYQFLALIASSVPDRLYAQQESATWLVRVEHTDQMIDHGRAFGTPSCPFPYIFPFRFLPHHRHLA